MQQMRKMRPAMPYPGYFCRKSAKAKQKEMYFLRTLYPDMPTESTELWRMALPVCWKEIYKEIFQTQSTGMFFRRNQNNRIDN